MKKIVFICDGEDFSTEAFEFVKTLHQKEPFLLTGAFFHSNNYGLLISNTFVPDAGPYMSFTEEDNVKFLKGIETFEKLCKRNNIEYRVHEESNEWKISDLIKESRFADFMIVSASSFFSNVSQGEAKAILHRTLHSSECPVMVVPDKAERIEKVVFAYDGKKDSVFALKQFTYLFPQYCDLDTTILYFNDGEDEEIPDLQYIEEFAASHFTKLNFEQLNFSKKTFSLWINQHKNALLVSGAYNRPGIARVFKDSFADDIINSLCVPVFISHL